jgi:hypothetical protein
MRRKVSPNDAQAAFELQGKKASGVEQRTGLSLQIEREWH